MYLEISTYDFLIPWLSMETSIELDCMYLIEVVDDSIFWREFDPALLADDKDKAVKAELLAEDLVYEELDHCHNVEEFKECVGGKTKYFVVLRISGDIKYLYEINTEPNVLALQKAVYKLNEAIGRAA